MYVGEVEDGGDLHQQLSGEMGAFVHWNAARVGLRAS